MERKRIVTFEDVARFLCGDNGIGEDHVLQEGNTMSRAEIREDRRVCPFAVINFRGILGASRQGAKGEPFYNPFMAKFMEYKLPVMKELQIWL